MKRTFFRTLFGTLVVGTFAVAGLLAVELFLRVGSNIQMSGLAFDPVTGWRYLRNTTFVAHGEAVTTNSRGFRDQERTDAKESGTLRVMVLADSYGAGMGIPQDTLFPNVLEQYLNRLSLGYKVEVLNRSVSAWSTDQQLRYLREEGMREQPDVVLLIVTPNDMREAFNKGFFRLKKDRLVESEPELPTAYRWAWHLTNHSALFQSMNRHFKWQIGDFATLFKYYSPFGKTKTGWRHQDDDFFEKPARPWVERAYRLHFALLEQIHALCEARGVRLVLSTIPLKSELLRQNLSNFVRGQVRDRVARNAESLNVDFIDLHPPFLGYKRPKLLFRSGDYHFGEKGHRLAAEALALGLEPTLAEVANHVYRRRLTLRSNDHALRSWGDSTSF